MGGKKFVITTIGTGLVLIFSYLFLITQFSWNKSVPSHASAKTWGGGATGVWESGSNWSPAGVPTSADDVTIDNATVTLTSGQTANFNTLTIGSGSATTLILEGNIGVGGTTTIANSAALTQKNSTQQVLSGSLIIQSGATLNHWFNTTNQDNILNIKAQNINLQSGGFITASQQGFQSSPSSTDGSGPGGGHLGTLGDGAGGGGHGGNGGDGVGVSAGQGTGGAAYCTINNVSTIGSGGGGSLANGNSSGGGLIILEAVDTLTLNGTVAADAVAALPFSASGGGAGGGIKLTAATIAGTPTSLSALGGGGDTAGGTSGGGGGGGCIQVRYKLTNSLMSGQLNVNGGAGGNAGSTGLKSIAQIPVAAPTGLSTSSILPTAINLNWTPGNGGETSYVVEQSTSGGPFVFVNSVALSTTTYKFTSLNPDIQYTFRIAGVNGSSTSTYAVSSPVYTAAVDISALTLSNPTTSTLAITFGSTNGNPTSTTYAIYDDINAIYLSSSGTPSASPLYFTTSSWGGVAHSLFSNTTYRFFALSRNGDGLISSPTSSLFNSSTSNATSTLINNPGAPTSPSASLSSLQLILNANNNSPSTTYAIYNITNGMYVSVTGSPSGIAVYFTTSSWGGVVTGLSPETGYQFVVFTSNNLPSPTSSVFTTLSDSASPSLASGGGSSGLINYILPPTSSPNIPTSSVSSSPATSSPSIALQTCNLTNPDCSSPLCQDLSSCFSPPLTNLPLPPPEPEISISRNPFATSSFTFSFETSSLPLTLVNTTLETLACKNVQISVEGPDNSTALNRVSLVLGPVVSSTPPESSPLVGVPVSPPTSSPFTDSPLAVSVPPDSSSSSSSSSLSTSPLAIHSPSSTSSSSSGPSLSNSISQAVFEISSLKTLISNLDSKLCPVFSDVLSPPRSSSLVTVSDDILFRLQNQNFEHFPGVSIPSLQNTISSFKAATAELSTLNPSRSCRDFKVPLQDSLNVSLKSLDEILTTLSSRSKSIDSIILSDNKSLTSLSSDSAATRRIYTTIQHCSINLPEPTAFTQIPKLQASLLAPDFLNDPVSIRSLLASTSSSVHDQIVFLDNPPSSRSCLALASPSPELTSFKNSLSKLQTDLVLFEKELSVFSVSTSTPLLAPAMLKHIEIEISTPSTSTILSSPLLLESNSCSVSSTTSSTKLVFSSSSYKGMIPGIPDGTMREGAITVLYTSQPAHTSYFTEQTITPGTVTLDSVPAQGRVELFNKQGQPVSSTVSQPNPQLLTRGEYVWIVPNGEYRLGITLTNGEYFITPPFLVRTNLVNRHVSLTSRVNIKKAVPPIFVQETSSLLTSTPALSVRPLVTGSVVSLGLTLVVLLLLNSLSGISALLRLVLLQPFLILFGDKQNRFGLVYNALSKQPIDLARVSLYEDKTNRLVQTYVTGKDGRFAFQAPIGTYYIVVQKEGLIFPSKILAKIKTDGKKGAVYHGEKIVVTKDNPLITPSIPLDPPGKIESLHRLQWKSFRNLLQIIISLCGIILTCFSLVINPLIWESWILLALHFLVLALFIRLLSRSPKPKGWGIVYDENKKPLGNTVVRLFNNDFNKLVSSKITDNRGRYFFLAGDSNFKVSFERIGFEPAESKEINLKGKESSFIMPHIALKKS
jgi:hypothetical protein